jgi:hypothetical protein
MLTRRKFWNSLEIAVRQEVLLSICHVHHGGRKWPALKGTARSENTAYSVQRRTTVSQKNIPLKPTTTGNGQTSTENGQMNGVLRQGTINDCVWICPRLYGRQTLDAQPHQLRVAGAEKFSVRRCPRCQDTRRTRSELAIGHRRRRGTAALTAASAASSFCRSRTTFGLARGVERQPELLDN